MFHVGAGRNGLGLLDLRDVVVGCLRSVISSESGVVDELTFMVD